MISSVADIYKKVYVAQLCSKKISHFLHVEFLDLIMNPHGFPRSHDSSS